MQIYYDSRFDLLYLRLSAETQKVINIQITEEIILDRGEGDKIIGIEILDASKHVNLESLMPVEYLKAG